MGFLKIFGVALEWEDSKQYIDKIKSQGIDQIIKWIKSIETRVCQIPKFGYEVEFHKVIINEDTKKVKLDNSGQDDVYSFIEAPHLNEPFILQPEYGRWMIEVVPNFPFKMDELVKIQGSMESLYRFMNEKVGKDKVLSMSSFPMMGVNDFYVENTKTKLDEENKYNLHENPFSKSTQFKDVCINSHPRFACLTRNIRQRRGEKVNIQIPIYKDEKTNLTMKTNDEPFPGYIYADAMGFGMGSCCFQITVGACSLEFTCYIYDQFVALSPILLALSAASPFFKGKLSGHDVRFDVISQSVDDRTEEERNPESKKYINKSRYGPAYSYISQSRVIQDFHNDYQKFPINEEYYKKLMENNIPSNLSTHICNLFVRDPLVIFDKNIVTEDEKDYSHFENLQSTNWNSVRFKPPRIEDNDSCFKVEIRPCELQLTAYENAAMASFAMLINKMNRHFKVNFVIPITKVDENMRRSYLNDAVTKQKFYFRTNFLLKDYKTKTCSMEKNLLGLDESYFNKDSDNEKIKEMTIDEILSGCETFNYPGLLPVIYEYLDIYEDPVSIKYYKNHLEFLKLRSKGVLSTDAKYLRNFVLNHPQYKKDSVLNDVIVYDLIKHSFDIQNGSIYPEELFVKELLN